MLVSNNHKELLAKKRTKYIEVYYDIEKAYDSVIHSTLIEKLKKKGIEKRVIKAIQRILEITSIELFCGGQDLGNVKVKRGVIQGDSLSPLLFVIYI